MERGFKSRCENMAKGLRRELGLADVDPLPPQALASYLEIPVLTLTDIPNVDPTDIHQLLVEDPGSWSAMTVSNGSHEVIITNSQHRGGRPATDIMHELAHLLLGHPPSTMFFVAEGDAAIRGYNKEAEEEADWLAGTLLLPRDVLVYMKTHRISEEAIRQEYEVSQSLLRERLDRTGVNRQFRGSSTGKD